MSWLEPSSTRHVDVPLFPDWKSRQQKYNFGFPRDVDSRTEPLRLDPPLPPPPHQPSPSFPWKWLAVASSNMPEKKLKVGDENFLRSSRRFVAASRDVYSSFNHTLGLRRGSGASLEDTSALCHVATHRKWRRLPLFNRKCERGLRLKRAGTRCVCASRSLLLFRGCGGGDVRRRRGEVNGGRGQHAIEKQTHVNNMLQHLQGRDARESS